MNAHIRAKRSSLPRAIRLSGVWVFLGGVVFLITRHVAGNLDALGSHHWTLRWDYCLASVLLLGCAFTITGAVWAWQLRALGTRISIGRAIAGAFVAALGKYAPGKIWATLGRVYFVCRDGVPRRSALPLAILVPTQAYIAR